MLPWQCGGDVSNESILKNQTQVTFEYNNSFYNLMLHRKDEQRGDTRSRGPSVSVKEDLGCQVGCPVLQCCMNRWAASTGSHTCSVEPGHYHAPGPGSTNNSTVVLIREMHMLWTLGDSLWLRFSHRQKGDRMNGKGQRSQRAARPAPAVMRQQKQHEHSFIEQGCHGEQQLALMCGLVSDWTSGRWQHYEQGSRH